MKSKASFNDHPIHLILNVFPIAFFIGSLLFDIIAIVSQKFSYWQTGTYLNAAGIITGLIAAVPGFIDFLYTIPPQSSAKKRGVKHGLINVFVVVLFIVSLLLRKDSAAPSLIVAGIELAAVVLLCIAGFMGGTLVVKNQIGVFNRYADKGKWQEGTAHEEGGKWLVGTANELKQDQMKLMHVNGKRIVVGRTANGFVAFDDRCTHKGGSLAGGVLICDTVQCPWHGSQFDVTNGSVKAGPAGEKINTYEVTLEGEKIFLLL